MVRERLPEQSVSIIDAKTLCRIAKCRYRVHKACRQASQASAAERGFRLILQNILKFLAVPGQKLFCLSIDPEIDQGIKKKPSGQELRRDIVDLLLSAVLLAYLEDPLDKQHQNKVCLFIAAFFKRLSESLMRQLRELFLHIHHHNIKDHVPVTHRHSPRKPSAVLSMISDSKFRGNQYGLRRPLG